MRTLTIVAIVAALATPAYAQNNFGGGASGGMKPKSEQEKAQEAKQRKLEDKAYRDSLSRIPDKEREKKSDPWGNMR